MCQQTEPPLVQVMPCHPFGAMPLHKPMLVIDGWPLRNKFLRNLNQNITIFTQRNHLLICLGLCVLERTGNYRLTFFHLGGFLLLVFTQLLMAFDSNVPTSNGGTPLLGGSPVNFPHKGQWRGALMFSLIYTWINDWVNNREAGDLRRQNGHYDVIVML